MNTKNLIFFLDSYKQLHDVMYPEGTEYVYSYLEARKGGEYGFNIFFGLQYFLKEYLRGIVLTKQMVDEAEPVMKEHFKFNGNVWKRDKWDYIINTHNGKLPIVIKAVPEGTKVPAGNVLMTIENTDPKCFWLTNGLETLLQNLWFSCTVTTRSHSIVENIKDYFKQTVDDDLQWLADFYLHDFGQRATTCPEQAGLGGMAHLINSLGTDTDLGILYALKYYNANIEGLAYSVPASEHSQATALGRTNEFEVTKRLIKLFPKGILSVVSDSYDIENAVRVYCSDLKKDILARDGKFVVRPDSSRFEGDIPAHQVAWIAKELEKSFGSIINSKGYKVLNDKVGIIYGDSLSEIDIENILYLLKVNRFAASTCVFGQGGGLLQKLNRDTCRFAFKSSAQCRNGVWYDIYKEPKDTSKASKRGKLMLCKTNEIHTGFHDGKLIQSNYETVAQNLIQQDELVEVFRDGNILKEYNFHEIRQRAKSEIY